ncbi:C2 calcium-dependent domain-containing protein 4C-like [Anguilla anguilla]|uniref:C2 calcium-dependent domain-containing protein 4C-like n=1 Tax=Anguilla anguilla TaxID=7936 RepID=UPI0015ADA360|nr:C2 calcium-dependent domain-containing protein 4C-like [Anguilla anguilla]
MPTLTVIQTRHPSVIGTCAPEYKRNGSSALSGGRGTPRAMKTRQVSLRDMVVTPDRVPKFTIPALAPSRRTRAQNSCGLDESTLGSPHVSRRHTMTCLPHSPASHRVCNPGPESDLIFWGEIAREDLSDPLSRAAMSIPHLPKITTPYGFLTLGESPSVRRRESLFFEDEIPRFYISGTGGGKHLTLSTMSSSRIVRTQSYPLSDIEKFPRTIRTLRSFSCGTATSFSCDPRHSETYPQSLQTSLESRLSIPPASASPGRGRLQRLLKKRLAALRTLKPSRCVGKRHSIDIKPEKNALSH